MKIIFTPARSDKRLRLARDGDTLLVNGKGYDFSELAAGQSLPCEDLDCDWLIEDPYRSPTGELVFKVLLPHGPNAKPARLNPEPIIVRDDGKIALP